MVLVAILKTVDKLLLGCFSLFMKILFTELLSLLFHLSCMRALLNKSNF
ncbi:Uncharacterised protein [Serratia fonticola]|uniref:Uncharacterized protein n=1 Tax=Serratia fonticola TaxID=47917 RepID=A0A448SK84_SERFO|nr:Uncharacterised protein [Serratia fonticola]